MHVEYIILEGLKEVLLRLSDMMILKSWKICYASKVILKSTLQVPLVAALGFEPTALGVCQATNAVLQYHSEGKAGGEAIS